MQPVVKNNVLVNLVTDQKYGFVLDQHLQRLQVLGIPN